MTPAKSTRLLSRQLAEAHARERSFDGDKKISRQWAELQKHKWDIIGDLLLANTFTVTQEIPRSEQWVRVRSHLMKLLNEPEITEWLSQQMEIADNLAAGVHEMRPRKSGPCYGILMEWVVNRKRKTRAVVKWMKGGNEPDFPTFV